MRLVDFFLFLIVVACVAGDIFKKCADVEFCNNLRTRLPEESYVPSYSHNENNTYYFKLESSGDLNDLQLEITSLENDTFRIKIHEFNSTRYELADVLDGEPTTTEIDLMGADDSGVSLIVGNNRVDINFSPFYIQFSKDDLPSIVFFGNRLIVENTESSQAMAFGISFPYAIRSYGLPIHAERLPLQKTAPGGLDPYRLRNVDYGNWELYSPKSLYGSIPVLYGHGLNFTSGVFFHNGAQQFIDLKHSEVGEEAYFMSEGGNLDLFVLLGPTPTNVLQQYLSLTGTAHLPQLWTLGYHQCRYSYMTQEEVKEVVANLDSHNFPLDAIWLDIDYTDGKRYFTWNPDTYSDPIELQQNVSSTNRKMVTIIDPHIKVEEGYDVYDGALEADLFVKNADGSNLEGDCWPGLSSYMDFLNPAAREYYGDYYSYDKFANTTPTIAGIWNDMNEPSVFNDSIEKTFPNDAVHYGGVLHRDIVNLYGLYHTMSTHQGLLKRDNNEKRPFVLSRSSFAGSQRYAGIWTGDGGTSWEYLYLAIPMCLNENLVGMIICGSDVGGFTGNPDEELLQRWYQVGAWLPFFREHSDTNTEHREPYLYSEDVQAVIRTAIQSRYKHIPQWYTLFYEYVRDKLPVIRPLFYHYPNDENVFDIDHEWLVGRDILVSPVLESNASIKQVYFPGNEDEYWVDPETSYTYNGGNTTDIDITINSTLVYYRSGGIVVRKDTPRPSTADMVNDSYSIYSVLDKEQKAHGTVYLDDYESFKYKDNLEYSYLRIDVEYGTFTLTPIDDDANSDGFEFNVVAFVIYNRVFEGESTMVEMIRYDRDVNGNLLKDMKFDLSKKVTIKLK